jgi:hypothetical protein
MKSLFCIKPTVYDTDGDKLTSSEVLGQVLHTSGQYVDICISLSQIQNELYSFHIYTLRDNT